MACQRETEILHGCIKNFINWMKKQLKDQQTKDQADNPPFRYATVMTHACVVLVLVVSSKR